MANPRLYLTALTEDWSSPNCASTDLPSQTKQIQNLRSALLELQSDLQLNHDENRELQADLEVQRGRAQEAMDKNVALQALLDQSEVEKQQLDQKFSDLRKLVEKLLLFRRQTEQATKTESSLPKLRQAIMDLSSACPINF
jgi:predicted nuclease with TOPRIM domain